MDSLQATIVDAVVALSDRKGSTQSAIQTYVHAHHKDVEMSPRALRLVLKKAVAAGSLACSRGLYRVGGDPAPSSPSRSPKRSKQQNADSEDQDTPSESCESADEPNESPSESVAESLPRDYDSEDERALSMDIGSMIKDAVMAIIKAADEDKPTAENVLEMLRILYKVTDMSLDELKDRLKDGTEAGWLIPEEDGSYYLKEPIQTPDRPHAQLPETGDLADDHAVEAAPVEAVIP